MPSNLQKELDDLIDRAIGHEPELVYKALEAVAAAAYATAEHLGSNWDDQSAAKAWIKIGKLIEKTAGKVEKLVPF